jgi:hypothetical protein
MTSGELYTATYDFQVGQGILSAAANNVLTATLSGALLTGTVYFTGIFGQEE